MSRPSTTQTSVDLVQCLKCFSRNVRVRSSGEGMTTMIECRNCTNQWKETGGTIFARILIRE